MILVFDADILSTLIKTSRQNLVRRIFPKAKIIIPQKVHAELKKGYFAGKKLLESVSILDYNIDSAEEKDINALEIAEKSLHSGELEAIAIAKRHKGMFLSNDKVALKVARELNINTMSLREMLLLVSENKILDKEGMERFLSDIERKDYTFIVGQDEIVEKAI